MLVYQTVGVHFVLAYAVKLFKKKREEEKRETERLASEWFVLKEIKNRIDFFIIMDTINHDRQTRSWALIKSFTSHSNLGFFYFLASNQLDARRGKRRTRKYKLNCIPEPQHSTVGEEGHGYSIVQGSHRLLELLAKFSELLPICP